MKTFENIGILTSISWSDNNWTSDPSDDDKKNSNYQYVKDNQFMYESLNFGNNIYPAEADGSYIGHSPMFNKIPRESIIESVKIVFFSSTNHSAGKKYIVGCYAFPIIQSQIFRTAKHDMFEKYPYGTLKSNTENISAFANRIEIDNDIVKIQNWLPRDKEIGTRGFNYLNSENVLSILDKAVELNPEDSRIKNIKNKLLKIHL
jgi:5-methylcytosine-specific restriction protein A